MTDRRYTLPRSLFVGYSPAQALETSMASLGRGPVGVVRAMFDVLTESQQERVLQAMGWQLVPPPAVEPAPPSP